MKAKKLSQYIQDFGDDAKAGKLWSYLNALLRHIEGARGLLGARTFPLIVSSGDLNFDFFTRSKIGRGKD